MLGDSYCMVGRSNKEKLRKTSLLKLKKRKGDMGLGCYKKNIINRYIGSVMS